MTQSDKQRGCLALVSFIGGMALVIALALGIWSLWAGEAKMSPSRKQMSRDELIQLALSAAPPHIAKEAAVMLPGEDGKLVEARKGTNGFACVPDPNPGAPKPDPICMDQATFQWFTSFKNNEPKPANTVPGIAYMAKGAQGWVKDGKLLQKQEPGAKLVDFPPHWMIFWPFDSRTSGFSSCTIEPEKIVRPGSVCIVWDGSPYASLTVFQDPAQLKLKER